MTSFALNFINEYRLNTSQLGHVFGMVIKEAIEYFKNNFEFMFENIDFNVIEHLDKVEIILYDDYYISQKSDSNIKVEAICSYRTGAYQSLDLNDFSISYNIDDDYGLDDVTGYNIPDNADIDEIIAYHFEDTGLPYNEQTAKILRKLLKDTRDDIIFELEMFIDNINEILTILKDIINLNVNNVTLDIIGKCLDNLGIRTIDDIYLI